MKLDWFTVIAQVCNFLLLVWLLRKFLYRPILEAIDHREKQVADEVLQAEVKKKEAEQLRLEYEQKNIQLAQQENVLMDHAKAEAKEEKEKLLKSTREEIEAIKKQWREEWNKELLKIEQSFVDKGKVQVLSIVKSTLKELANVTLEDYMIKTFIHHLQNSNEAALEKFETSSESFLITTAQTLLPEQQRALEEAISKLVKHKFVFQYRVSPELITGIEVSSGQYKISWTASQYLNTLEEKMKLFIEQQTKESLA